MKRSRRPWVWSIPILALAVLAVLALRSNGGFGPLDAGRTAPSYAARTLEGDTLDLESLRGRAVLLNVWATWCKPCVREMPALQRVHELLEPEGLSIVAVSVDNAALGLGDPGRDVAAFVEEYGITFTVLLDPESRVESAFQVMGLPMTFLIDRDGRVRQKILGARDWDQAEWLRTIRALLEN